MVLVPLVARKSLCVHPSMAKVETSTAVNEKCEDLNEKGLCMHNDAQVVTLLADNITAKPLDIEELG